MAESKGKLLVYSQKDMQMVMDFVDSLQYTGLAMARKVSTIGTILESGKFSATVLAESASMELIGRFGFQCSRDVDKFAGFAWARDINGVPYVKNETKSS